jgi:AraC-like DNA-binding protein
MERFGCSPREWLDALKLAAAKRRLLRHDGVRTVADAFFEQPPQFCRWFKQRTDVTPAEFKRRKAGNSPSDA